MKSIIVALLCIISFEATAQNTADTTKKKLGDTIKKDILTAPPVVKKLRSKAWTLVPPAIAIGYGVSSFVVPPVRRLDYYIRGDIRKYDPNFNTTAESYFLFTPMAMVYGLNLIGVEGKNRFIDRTMLLGFSAGILGLSELGIKNLSHRLRPNGADYFSFPSGHTGAAFMGAEFLAQEFGDKSHIYTVIGYTFAVTTGIFRMYNRDHWFSDVVAGAGFGIISTKAAYIVYPWLRNKLTHADKNGKTTTFMPSYQYGVPGFQFAMQL